MADRVHVYVLWPKNRPHAYLQWLDPDTRKRRTKSANTADPRQVEKERADLEYELTHGLRHPGRTPWGEFRARFEAEYLAGARPRTRAAYAQTFDRLERLCGPKAVGSVNEAVLAKYAAAMLREKAHGTGGHAKTTVRLSVKHLRTALRWAQDQGLLRRAPKAPAVRPPRLRPEPVPPEWVERLLDAAGDDATRAFLLCGWLAGLRLEEALELRRVRSPDRPWVNWQADRIVFPASFAKSDEDQWVPLDGTLREALLALPGEGGRFFSFAGPKGEPLDFKAVSKRVRALAGRAGVPLTMKGLRRGFACYWAERVPAQTLQKLMRHSNIAVTMEYYANVDEAAVEAIRSRDYNRERNRNQPTGDGGPGESRKPLAS